MPSSGRGGHEQHRVAERLDHPAAVAGDDVVAAPLEHLDQVADLVLVELVGQLAEADQVGEPDGGRRRARPRRRPGSPPARPPPRGAGATRSSSAPRSRGRSSRPAAVPRCGGWPPPAWPRRRRSARPPPTRPAGPSSCPSPRVSRTTVSKSSRPCTMNRATRVSASTSSLLKARSSPGLGEAQRTPEPLRLLDRQAGGLGDLVAGQLGGARRGSRARAPQVPSSAGSDEVAGRGGRARC